MQVSILRFNPSSKKQYYQEFTIKKPATRVLQLLQQIKLLDPSLSYRSSCQEGVCGSDAVNVNGKNVLACITKLADLPKKIIIRPLPGLAVIKDLIVDMEPFYAQYKKIKPFLVKNSKEIGKENLQSQADRKKLDGLYECILCGACTTSCPSYWWHGDNFLGPQALLALNRFVQDSRDEDKRRLDNFADEHSIFKCRTIMSCTDACPKNLNPTKSINLLKKEVIKS